MVEAQACFIKGGSISQSFPGAMKNLLAITHSSAGCIAEVSRSFEGEAYLQGYSLTNVGLRTNESDVHRDLEQNLQVMNIDCHLGQMITLGQPVIDNSPLSYF